jgi:hypothetical protein
MSLRVAIAFCGRAVRDPVEKAGITDGRVAPAIIPIYTEPEVRERQLNVNSAGNVR